MLVPLSWIRDFTPVDAPVPDLVSALNQLGLEVEGVEQPGAEITGVKVARVLGVEKHPDAVERMARLGEQATLAADVAADAAIAAVRSMG